MACLSKDYTIQVTQVMCFRTCFMLRRRIEFEDKAKVVASNWGTEENPCQASLRGKGDG